MHFPDGGPSGKRVPESRLRTGQTFRMKHSAETASRNRRSNWDTFSAEVPSGNRVHSERQFWDGLSARGFSRKRHPTLEPNSGTQFPVEGCSGKCVPFQARIPGCTFRLKLQPESASHSGAEFRDALSARGSKGKRIPFRAPIPGRSFRSKQKPRLAMEPGLKAQLMQLMVSANGRQQCCPRSTLAAVTGAAVRGIHHGQIRT